MNDNNFPKGWDEQKVQQLLKELESRTDDEWIAEDAAAASESRDQSVITVPNSMLPQIRKLLATGIST